jgi:hypothetical protein
MSHYQEVSNVHFLKSIEICFGSTSELCSQIQEIIKSASAKSTKSTVLFFDLFAAYVEPEKYIKLEVGCLKELYEMVFAKFLASLRLKTTRRKIFGKSRDKEEKENADENEMDGFQFSILKMKLPLADDMTESGMVSLDMAKVSIALHWEALKRMLLVMEHSTL